MKILEIREVHKEVFGPIIVTSSSEVVINKIKEFMKTVDLSDFLKEVMDRTVEEYISELL